MENIALGDFELTAAIDTIRIEAEDMTRKNYARESESFASGGQLIKARRDNATASTNFTGAAGNYDLVVAYHDENDGIGKFTVKIGGVEVDSWLLNQDLGSDSATSSNLVRRTINVDLNTNDTIEIIAQRHSGERMRLDYIELISGDGGGSPPPPGATIRIEAEDMTRKNYARESESFASGGKLIKARRDNATASTNFTGAAGNYDLVVAYHDENDGIGQFTVKVGGVEVDSWLLDQDLGSDSATSSNLVRRTINVDLNTNDTIEIIAQRHSGERMRLDYIELISGDGGGSPPPSGATIRIEAEDMTLDGYQQSSKSFASGGKIVKAADDTATASTNFTGATGNYDVVVAYHDENDGISQIQVKVGGVEVDSWFLDQDLGSGSANGNNLVRRTVAAGLHLDPNDTIEIIGTLDNGEQARLDYVEFIPSAANNEIDSEPRSGKIVNLDLGISFTPNGDFSPVIMPLGDSITKGTVGSRIDDDKDGGYRSKLWEKLKTLGLDVDFVGSLTDGPDSFDNDHNGYSGRTIDWLTQDDWSSFNRSNGQGHSGGLTGSIAEEKPNQITLMAGTNDTSNNSVSQMIEEMNTLIERITDLAPGTLLLVASIPPQRVGPNAQTQARADKAEAFNQALPGIVETWVNQGRNVSYVDMTSLEVSDISDSDVDNGLHPTDGGYEKIANFWYEAYLETAGTREFLGNTTQATGSNFDDKLIGDSGNNTIEGGLGADLLTGNGGSDIFVYNNANEGIDRFTDFGIDDSLQISASGFGGGLVAFTGLSTSASATGVFVDGENPTALGNSANFLYNRDSGVLSFDLDGIGEQDASAIAIFDNAPSLSASQFSIVA